MPAFYIVLQKPIPGVDAVGLEGRALSRHSDKLEALAKQAGVLPLISFFSMKKEEALKFLDSADDGVQRNICVPDEQWFSAEDGLKTIACLLKTLAGTSPESVALTGELQEFHRVLEAARAKNVSWHLAIDI